MIRVRLAVDGNFQTRFGEEPYMVVKYDWPNVSYNFTDGGTYYQIETSKLIVRVNKSPLIVSFYDKSMNLINKDNDTNRMGWENTGLVYCGKDMPANEQFYGLGEQYAPDNNNGIMSYRGYTMEIWATDSQCEDYRPSYANVPWFISNKRYGIFFHNMGHIYYRFGTEATNRYSFESQSGELDYYFIYGGNDSKCYKTILDRYTELTGRPELPPDWVFGLGLIIGADSVSSAASNWRNSGIPGDMIGIDAGWYTACGSFQFSNDGQNNVNTAHNSNFKLWVWQVPLVVSGISNYTTGSNNGYFGRNNSGGVYQVSLWIGTGGYIDCFKSAARTWYKQIMNVKDSGGSTLNPPLDCFKTDDGEYTPDDTGFLMGEGVYTYNGREIHNSYGLIYNRTVWEKTKEWNNGRGFVFHRNSYAGGQRTPVLWAGDNGSTFGDASQWGKAGMDNTLRAGLSMAWTGFSFWTSDSGGCDGTRPNDELFQRWVCEWSNFLPFHVINDYTGGNRAPWYYSASMQNVMKKYTKLHYRLFPYIYTYAYESTQNGTPIMRPMLMEFPDDTNCEQIGGRPTTTVSGQQVMPQYMFGDWLLVCPVVTAGATSRNVYFPQGVSQWINYWDGTTKYTNPGVVNVSAPVDVIPVFVKGGAIIPMIDDRDYMRQIPNNRITLDIYPYGTSSFTLYEDDGSTLNYLTGSYAKTTFECIDGSPITINIGARTGSYTGMPTSRYYRLNVHNVNSAPVEVRRDGTNVLTKYNSTSELDAASEGWYYDSTKKMVDVKPSQSITGAFQITIHTVAPGPAVKILCSANPTSVVADGIKTSTVTAGVYDANDNLVTNSNASITFTKTGPGTLIGTNPVTVSRGIARIIFRTSTSTGTATITATSSGLTQGQVNITCVPQGGSNNPPTEPTNLTCDGQTNPKNVSNLNPILGWKFNDPDTGNMQAAYRLLVANSLTNINNNNGNMWDTNKTNSASNTVMYTGSSLLPGSTYYWKVMTWDNYDLQGPYSSVASFVRSWGGPYILVSTKTLDFGAVDYGQTASLSFDIENAGGGTLTGTLITDQDWITIDPPSFSVKGIPSPETISITVTVDNNVLGMKEGEYTGNITITSNGGNETITVHLKATCVLVKPNPYNPKKGLLTFFGDGIVPGQTTIKIYSLSGELVKELKNISRNEITWDGKTEHGNTVISGIYLYIYESPKEKGIGKFTVILE